MSGKGIGPGKKAFSASRRRTLESFPIDHSMTGLSKDAATSRMMWIDSASSCSR